MNIKGNNIPFPIDAVYLWVDGNDPQWLAKKKEVIRNSNRKDVRLQHDALAEGRFADNGELRHSLRSIALYAPWIRNVYIVTDNQYPSWINHDRIRMVDHKEIFPNFATRPCYSSRAIELCVHRIKNLTEHYLLFNDDVFLGSRVFPHDFFLPNGKPVLWVVKKRRKYKQKLLSDTYMQMKTYRGADTFARRLIKETYGRYLPYRVRHYPKPMLRKVMHEIWKAFPEETEYTLSHHFRKNDDILIGSFFSFYMIATNQAKPRIINGVRSLLDYSIGRTRHITATAGDKNFGKRLKQIEKQKPMTFCINDGETSTDRDRQTTKRFLAEHFTEKSIYEN